MSFWKKIFGGGGSTPDSQPFMEHPNGDFDNVVAAMEDAVKRLRKLPKWDQWITFGAQGEGDKPESYEFADVRMMGDKLDVGERPMDVPRIIQAARTGATSLVAQGAHYSVAAASPREVAQILDAISRSISAFARFQTRATIMPSERNGRERQMKDLFREANLR